MKTNGLSVESISIDNCIISKVSQSGYAVICDEKEQEKVGEISITNTTLKEIGMLLRTNKGVQSVVIDRCTFYNHTFGTGNMFRIDAQPTEMTVTNLILAGDNAGMEFGCYKNYDYLDFSTCYITNELAQAKYGFTNVITFAGTAEDLFVAPENGDFHIKPNVNFGGKGKAGDPRWEEE